MRPSPLRRASFGFIVMAILASTAWAQEARADVLPVSPSVENALSGLRGAKGVETYAALRGLWQTWDQGDPLFVEEALSRIEEDSRLSPPVRAYAGILDAYARRRRGDLAGAKSKLRRLGMVDRWIVVGPFDNEGRSGAERQFLPELELDQPIDPARIYDGKERPVRWRATPDVYGYGWLDFGDLFRPAEKVCGYATTFVRSKSGRRREASIWVGAAGAHRVFWNGQEVLADGAYRQIDVDRMAARVTVQEGWNRLTAKVCGDDEPPMLSLRLADSRGAPDSDLEISADWEHAAEAAKHAVGASARKPSASPRLEGPLQTFERLVSVRNPSPAVLEAYARYLQRTSGDDRDNYRARDLALRAASLQPTIARCLLAAELVEDRNQQRVWITKARQLAGKGPVPTEVLLAEAELARTGANFRDAIPYYDEVLARDPDNVQALLGRVDLYMEAGLRLTALAWIEEAVRRQPMSVALLREYAGHLRQQGRETEAAEVEERYAALRFDDATYLMDRIDLAVARRDEAAAARWVERFLETMPDSAWALGKAARAWRSLGKEGQAVAMYQRALELAPEDVNVLRDLSDLYGEMGLREEQTRLLQKILAIRPQATDVREYVEHMEPAKPRADEAYAWEPERFLAMRDLPADGQNKRTLRDVQVTTVFPNGLSSQFRQVVYQPLTEEAAAAAREYAFAYQADSEIVQIRAARVYRADGRIDEAIETGEAPANDPSIAMYTSGRVVYVQFPRLSAGDVVELRYRVESVTPRNEFADYFGEVRYLQSSDPIASAEYVLRAPKDKPLFFHASPGIVRHDETDGDNHVYRFVAENTDPIVPENDMPPFSEVAAHVHVSTYESWNDLARWYWGLAKDQFAADDEVRALVKKLTEGLTDPRDKVRAIYGWVVQRTRYVALEFGIYGYKPRRASQTLARGWGDCKDKSTLIITMLKEAGIDASIVLVRTQMRGDIAPEPASLASFDHAIAYVPSLDLFLDGTAEYVGSTELSPMIRGSLALIVNPDGSGKLVRLPDPGPEGAKWSRKVEATLGKDGSAQLDVAIETSGAYASQWRQRYHAEGTRRERVTRDIGQTLPGFELSPSGLTINDLEDIEQPVRVLAKGKAPAFARRDGADLSLVPGSRTRLVPRYASASSRKQDLRIPAQSLSEEELVLALPEGMTVKSAPDPVKVETPFGTYALAIETEPGKVKVKSSLELTKTRITPAEYAAFRAFCEGADRAFSQRLVIGEAQ